MANTKGYHLTHALVKSVAKEGRHGDGRGGHGLSLLVKRAANGRWSKSWSQRIRVRGRLATLGLGAFPAVTLAMARDRALDNARRVEQGEDILRPPAPIPTVDAAFDRVIADRKKSWTGERTVSNWHQAKRHCRPLGSKLVSEVAPKDVLDLITPLWHEKAQTARYVRSKLSVVMEWSITEGFRTATNPAKPSVTSSLGRQEPATHHKSLPPSQLGSALAIIRDSDGWWAIKCCLSFIAFTGARSGEARRATWDQIDLATSTWTIPASRMKARKLHVVPLSTQAKGILAYAGKHGNGSQGLIFPPERGGQYIRSRGPSGLMKRLEMPAVPHGSRSSFINWASSQAHIPEPVAEMVLAHTPSAPVIRSYRTADFFEYRIPVMQEWADFLSETMGPVVMEPETPAKEPAKAEDRVRAPRPQEKERTSEKDQGRAKATPVPRRKTNGATASTVPADGSRRLVRGAPGAQLPLGAGVD